MKISYNWLKNYIDLNDDPKKVSQWLTDCGLEVEGLEQYQSVKGALEGVVIGKVVSCKKHPDADKLTLTTVDIGSGEPLRIVCGAPNVEPGQMVPVAVVGTTLYSDKGSFEIKKAKIRGQLSQGMICAEDELGLGSSHEGIMVLDMDTPIGTPAKEYFKIEDDWVFEIGLTPNRIDAASHIGVARDLAAVKNQLFCNQNTKVKYPSVNDFKIDDNSLLIPVEIEDKEACIRYSGVTVSGITVKESPEWLKNKLSAIGLKPINNIVDITNFVLHETGQPLHAFDADKIKGNKVIISRPPKGAKINTLDEEDVELTGDDLSISDTEKPMCIAGVLGGAYSGISAQTTNMFLESACFNPKFIRNSSKHHQIHTDASFRFERGSDPNITLYALKRASMLIKEIAGGKISSVIVDEYPNPVENRLINLKYDKLNKLVGKNIDKTKVKNILLSLEIEIVDENEEVLKLSVPPYRADVTRPADVIEEILRIYGYNNIEIPGKNNAAIVISPKPDKEHLQNQISEMLSGQGFNEIMNNSLTKHSYYSKNDDYRQEYTVKILNPISSELNILRQTLLYGCLETISENVNHRNSNLKFYEFGNTYQIRENKSDNPHDKYVETVELALVITGLKNSETWKASDLQVDFFDLKNYVNQILQKLGIKINELDVEEKSGSYTFAYALEYRKKSIPIATIGKLSRNVLSPFDIEQDVFYASINWPELVKAHSKYNMQFEELAKFPEVRRDLALLIDENVSYKQIEQLAYKTEKKYLISVNLFDVYQDEKIGKNKKSYAVSFTLQDKEKTMTDKQIDKIMQKLAQAFQKELNATIR